MTGPRKIFVKTFGCQMNVYDSERMTELLAGDGFAATDAAEDADVIVLNTCHIREKAAEKVYSDLGRVREVKAERARAGKGTIVTVAGCVAQAEGAEILRRASAVDLVVGPQSYHRLGELVARAGAGHRIVETGFPEEDKFARLPERAGPRAVTAFLTVQEGCDKFCTFCVVPYTRGAEFSRTVADIEAEARRLADRGVREITLLGQNVNAYHGLGPDGRPWPLARLIDRLAEIGGIERIRYTTSHPHDMSDDLIAAHATQPKLMPYLHLPFQAGADRILAAMNRKHTADDYLAVGRAHPRGAPGPGAVDGHHRRLSRRDGCRVRGDTGDGGAGGIRAGVLVQVQPAPRHAGRGHGRAARRRGQDRAAAPAARSARAATNVVQFKLRGAGHAGPVRAGGPASRAARRALALPASRSCQSGFRAHWAGRRGCDRGRPRQQPGGNGAQRPIRFRHDVAVLCLC